MSRMAPGSSAVAFTSGFAHATANVAAPIVFLASPAASFANDITLPVDGGYLVV